MKEHSNVAVRYDLVDCHIDICSPEVSCVPRVLPLSASSEGFLWAGAGAFF